MGYIAFMVMRKVKRWIRIVPKLETKMLVLTKLQNPLYTKSPTFD